MKVPVPVRSTIKVTQATRGKDRVDRGGRCGRRRAATQADFRFSVWSEPPIGEARYLQRGNFAIYDQLGFSREHRVIGEVQ